MCTSRHLSVDISANSQSTYCATLSRRTVECRFTCRLRIGQYVDRYLVYMLTGVSGDISADTRSICWPMCGWHLALSAKYQLTYRPSLRRNVGWYVNRHSANQCQPSLSAKYRSTIDRYVGKYSAEMLTDTRLICWPTGALSTHDPNGVHVHVALHRNLLDQYQRSKESLGMSSLDLAWLLWIYYHRSQASFCWRTIIL